MATDSSVEGNDEPAVQGSTRRMTRSAARQSKVKDSSDAGSDWPPQQVPTKRRTRASTRQRQPSLTETPSAGARASLRKSTRKITALQQVQQSKPSRESEKWNEFDGHNVPSCADKPYEYCSGVGEEVKRGTYAILASVKGRETFSLNVKQVCDDDALETHGQGINNVIAQNMDTRGTYNVPSKEKFVDSEDNVVEEDPQSGALEKIDTGETINATGKQEQVPAQDNVMEEEIDTHGDLNAASRHNQIDSQDGAGERKSQSDSSGIDQPEVEAGQGAPQPRKLDQNQLQKLAIHNRLIARPPIISSPGKSPCVRQYVNAFENLRSPMTDCSMLSSPALPKKSKLKNTYEQYKSSCSVVLSPMKKSVVNTCLPLKMQSSLKSFTKEQFAGEKLAFNTAEENDLPVITKAKARKSQAASRHSDRYSLVSLQHFVRYSICLFVLFFNELL